VSPECCRPHARRCDTCSAGGQAKGWASRQAKATSLLRLPTSSLPGLRGDAPCHSALLPGRHPTAGSPAAGASHEESELTEKCACLLHRRTTVRPAPLYVFVRPGWAPGPWPRPRCWAPGCRRWPPRTLLGLVWPVHWGGRVRVSTHTDSTAPSMARRACEVEDANALSDALCRLHRRVGEAHALHVRVCLLKHAAWVCVHTRDNIISSRIGNGGGRGRQWRVCARTVFLSCWSPLPCPCLWPACCPAPA
jgi:hypothetical protein